MQLNKRIFIKGYILAETGILIGGVDAGQGIQGADKVVLRNPITEQPYIPGSTLKGKMRALAEQLAGEFGPAPGASTGGPIQKPRSELAHKIADVFGVNSDDKASAPNPRRLVVRDAKLLNSRFLENQEMLDLPYTEIKTEVTVDRITAKATPHSYERVPAGAVFELDIVLSAYDFEDKKDDAKDLTDFVLSTLLLLQDDCIGANGSRGYGKVRFHIDNIKMRDRESYLTTRELQDFTEITIPEALKLDEGTLEKINSQLA